MMITSSLPSSAYGQSTGTISKDTNSQLTASDKELIEFLGWSDDLETAESNSLDAQTLAKRIAQDRQEGTLSGNVDERYLSGVQDEQVALSKVNGQVSVTVAGLSRAMAHLDPPSGLPSGMYYIGGLRAFNMNDMLTASDKSLIEAMGGSKDLLTAEKADGVKDFAYEIASRRATGELQGEVDSGFLHSLVQASTWSPNTGGTLTSTDVLSRAIKAFASMQSNTQDAQTSIDANS